MRKTFCPVGEYRKMNKVPKKDPWHMESEDGMNLCGSHSKSQTPFETSVTCPKCKNIIELRSKMNNYFHCQNEVNKRRVCSFCGAVHKNPSYKLKYEPEGVAMVLSLCTHCKKFFLQKMKEFFE